MAGEIEEHLNDTDSLREDAIVTYLPDGRRAILGSDNKSYVLGEDGPNWDQPVDIHKEFDLDPLVGARDVDAAVAPAAPAAVDED